MQNIKIRKIAKKHGVYLWEIADKLDITDSSFSRKLRHELPPEEQARIIEIIRDIERSNWNDTNENY